LLPLITDAAAAETLLRLVQSVPSPKAEPIKLWLAKIGYERMQEMADPARSLARARETWQKQGRSAKWIEQRMTGQETRDKLTDYWAGHEIKKGDEYAILTNLIHQEWSEISRVFADFQKYLHAAPVRARWGAATKMTFTTSCFLDG
jgi:hypothetical protein